MKITRCRFFLALSCLLAVCPAYPQTPNQKSLVLVGTYTDKTGSKGIYAFDFDAASGKLTPRGLAAETSNPSWLVIHPNGKWAYAANESGKQSTITAFSIDAKSARLTLLNQLPALGEDPCYLSFDKTGKYLFVANYTSGNAVVFPILPDGKLGEHTAAVKDAGPLGPNKARQEAPHAHWIQMVPWRSVFVSDLGLDRVIFYDFDPSKGTLALHDATVVPNRPFAQASLELQPGSGPRHVVIGKVHDSREFIYVLAEIDSTVAVFVTSKEGIFGEIQSITTLPPGYSGRSEAAELVLHPNGRWLFASNRGPDSIAVFAVDSGAGTLRPAGIFPTGGKEPRHFALDPSGQFLLAENQNSNSIVVFRINLTTGALTQVSETDNIPSPVCLVFLPTP
ncbi:MAG TPA: lactonase family protein [Candidatus Acidoferrum sp.]|nr:lactonase family protein [Candidatus Acidoferrum sp.]